LPDRRARRPVAPPVPEAVLLRHHAECGLGLALVVAGGVVLDQSDRNGGIGREGKCKGIVVEPRHISGSCGIGPLLESLAEPLDVAGRAADGRRRLVQAEIGRQRIGAPDDPVLGELTLTILVGLLGYSLLLRIPDGADVGRRSAPGQLEVAVVLGSSAVLFRFRVSALVWKCCSSAFSSRSGDPARISGRSFFKNC